jgi:hypothetical protein
MVHARKRNCFLIVSYVFDGSISLCLLAVEGLVLPPYAPQDTPLAQPPAAGAAATNAQPPSASGTVHHQSLTLH